MNEINRIFKKTGTVLLVLGILDFAALLFCLATNHYYSSNFNLFAMIPGIFLYRNSIRTARFLRWFSLFAAVIACGFYCIITLSKPLDLILVQFRLNTYVTLMDLVSGLVFIGVLFWLYRQLSRAESLAALAAAGYKTGRATSAIASAAVIVILVAMGSYAVLTSASAEQARALAAAQYGDNYRYYVSSIEFSDEHGSAVVTVYNNEVLNNIKVEW